MKIKKEHVKGLILTWEDKDPRSTKGCDVTAGIVTHTNPVLRLSARKIFTQNYLWLYTQVPLVWMVEITLVFKYPNSTEQRETREVEGCFVFRDIADFLLEQFNDALRYGNEEHYQTTLYRIRCVSITPKNNPAN